MKSKRRALIKFGICPPELIKSFAPVRAKIQKAIDNNPKNVTLEQAKEQICRFQTLKPKI
jgi:hypothetical protein